MNRKAFASQACAAQALRPGEKPTELSSQLGVLNFLVKLWLGSLFHKVNLLLLWLGYVLCVTSTPLNLVRFALWSRTQPVLVPCHLNSLMISRKLSDVLFGSLPILFCQCRVVLFSDFSVSTRNWQSPHAAASLPASERIVPHLGKGRDIALPSCLFGRPLLVSVSSCSHLLRRQGGFTQRLNY